VAGTEVVIKRRVTDAAGFKLQLRVGYGLHMEPAVRRWSPVIKPEIRVFMARYSQMPRFPSSSRSTTRAT
jgi:hypothetical protein